LEFIKKSNTITPTTYNLTDYIYIHNLTNR